ncbi:Uncharacterised protein [Burkholderia pseudomallei]|uniref:hypothetical protein n=1 Tax=Burkholderia pseudomallei TaxID=28450 RepID=UPI000F14E483|nr:hypothetical protein [Burkholderia pseudomallei]MBF4048833.1 hypothetical protein [Burkholderia pseudomallei]CAJ4116151.1 Uncharacterised protein [Burkholderia pseudomallei]CAJ5012983.1 Uncharacterised protein [Burkholderia pseudomallei]CAJ6859564.1 Uncharacterised protein [Burkholderia pseudomallei]CAJ7293606.1 Uncharacterised protein [Burkholderia pseudomallei]
MLKTVNIVWAAGNEGYHIERALRDFREQDVLGALAEQVQGAGLASNYTDAMRRAVGIVDYHRAVQNGATICKQAHVQLQQQAATQARVKLV